MLELSQKNKFVISSAIYARWGGTHPLLLGAGFHARPLLGQPPMHILSQGTPWSGHS